MRKQQASMAQLQVDFGLTVYDFYKTLGVEWQRNSCGFVCYHGCAALRLVGGNPIKL